MVVCRLTGRKPRQGKDDVQVYPPLEDVMAEERLQEVETYASIFHNTVSQFIATRTIMELCLEAE